jgi:hypothetical protein
MRKFTVAKCISCNPADDTKPEHILLNAPGGRKKTTRVDCSACNNTFGSAVDDEVGKQVGFCATCSSYIPGRAERFLCCQTCNQARMHALGLPYTEEVSGERNSCAAQSCARQIGRRA